MPAYFEGLVQAHSSGYHALESIVRDNLLPRVPWSLRNLRDFCPEAKLTLRPAATVQAPRTPLQWCWRNLALAVAFIAVAALNSAVSLPAALTKPASQASAYALACAMAALGMDSNMHEIRKLGPKPLILAGALWAWLLGAGFIVARALVGV